MPDLETRLTALAPALAWPPTPRFAIPLPAPRGGLGWGRRLALAAAAVLVIAASLIALPPTRDAIASWVNLHVLIHRINNPPTPSASPDLGLGNPVTPEAAQGDVTWHVVVPSSLGPPDHVYFQAPPTGPSQGEVSLVYTARPILITEARGRVDEAFFGKTLGPGTTLENVTVAGHQGYWISGQPHVFFFIDASGQIRDETLRLATNTLVFDDNGTIVRIEGDLTKDQALQIAASMK